MPPFPLICGFSCLSFVFQKPFQIVFGLVPDISVTYIHHSGIITAELQLNGVLSSVSWLLIFH